MATRRKVEFQGTFDIQAILSAVDTLQNRLSKIQLNDSSARRFEKTFADLKKRAQEIDAEIKQGFTNTSQINTFNNHLQKLGQQMEILKGEIGRIDTSFSNLQLSPALQKQFESLKNSANTMFDAYASQISNIESKISSFAGKTGIKFEDSEINGLAQAISSSEKLNQLQEKKRISLEQERIAVQNNISLKEEELKKSEQALEVARKKQEATSAEQAAQMKKVTETGKEFGSKSPEYLKELDIQKQLTAKNNDALDVVIKRKKAQELINGSLEEERNTLSKIENSLSNLTKFFNGLKGDSSGLDDDAAAAAKEFADLSNKVSKLEKQLEEANAELQKFKDLQSKAANTNLGKSKKDIDTVGSSLKKASEETGRMSENLGNLNKQDQFFENLKSRATAVFGLTNAFIYMNRFIRQSVNVIKELDAAFTEIAVVTDMTTTQLWKSFDTYNEMAQKLGTTTVDAIKTSALYYQQGLETAEVMVLTEETMKMARIAGMDFAEATDRMTAALRGFKLEMSEASRVNDVFSALAAESAVDTDELSYALTKTASIAASAGMELETTSAFLSQMIETTREAPENIGTAMKTIIARFQELKTAVGDSVEIDGELVDVNKVDTALKSVGVQLRDSLTGQFRDLDDVFLELASKWDSLDRNTQRYVATIAAGSRQQSRFIAMMDNYERTLELVDIAQNSNGASATQFAKTLDSLETKINNIKSSFEEFIGTIVGSELVKDILDSVNTVLQMINNIAEAGPAAVAVFGTFFIMTIKKIISNFIGSAKTVSTAFTTAWTTVSGNYSTKMKEANQQAIVDLENRIRNSIMDKILADKIKNGVNAGVNNTPLNNNPTNTTTQQASNSMNWGNISNKEIKNIIKEYEKTNKISQDSRIKLNQAGVLNPQQQLFAKPSDIAESAKSYQKANSALATFTKKIGNLNPMIGQLGASIANIGTMAIMGNAATKGTAALGGATAGNMVGSLVGSLGYLIPGAGMVLGPIFQALGGTLGAFLGQGIGETLDNSKYGIGSEANIKRFKEEAAKVAEETSKSIEENSNLISLGEEYLSLSEKVNLTTEEKERLSELNDLLIEQYEGLSYAIDSENGQRKINIDDLKEEIKLKKELIAEDNARVNYANFNAEKSEITRANKDAADKALKEMQKYKISTTTSDKYAIFNGGVDIEWREDTSPNLERYQAAFGDAITKTSTQFQDLTRRMKQRFTYTLNLNKLTKEQLDKNKELLVEFAAESLNEGDLAAFKKSIDDYIKTIDENKQKLLDELEKLDSDISYILNASYAGVDSDSFSVQNKSYLNELLKVENILSEEEIEDYITTGSDNYEELLNRRSDLARSFINNLDSFNEKERDAFTTALSLTGLLGENKEESKTKIQKFLDTELEGASEAVKKAFNQIFDIQYDELSANWDNILGVNKDYVNKLADSFADGQGGEKLAARFASMTINAGDMAPAFIAAFQNQFESLLDKYAPEGENGREVITETAEEFEALMEALSSTNVTSANSIAQLGVKLKDLGLNESEVLQITNSLGSVFSRTGLSADEALSDIESRLEDINSLISIIENNIDGSLSLSQIDQLNTQLEKMGKNLLQNSQIVATGDGFKIQGDVGGIISSSTQGTRDYMINMAKEASLGEMMKKEQAAMAEANGDYERRNTLLEEANEYSKTSQYYLAAEADIRARTIKAQMIEANEEKKRLYDLIQQYKDMIAEMERYYNIQRKILQLQNEQKNFELDFELATNSDEAGAAARSQILNLVEQQALLKQAGQIYQKDLQELGNYINQDFGQFLTVDSSGNIFQNTDELVKLAEKMKSATEKESKELQKQWDSIQEVQTAYEDLYDTVNANSQEYKQNLIEQRKLEQQIKQYQVNLEKSLRDMIIKEMQDEVKATQDKYNKIKQEDQKYLSSLQKNISKRKQLQSDQDQDKEIETLQNRIGLLSRDTSGIYTKEIEDLQTELDRLLQEKANTALDRLYEEEEAKTQKISDELTLRSEYLQQQLDYELETYIISNQKIAELLKMKDSEILTWMTQHSEDFRKAMTTEQELFISQWTTQIANGKIAQNELTTNLEENKNAILNKFQEIKTGGIDVYIKAIDEANKADIVMDVNTKQLDVALAKLENLDDAKNDFMRDEAQRELDSLLVDIEKAYSAGKKAEGERLKRDYQSTLDLYNKYNGDKSAMNLTKYGDSYEGAQNKAQGIGQGSFDSSHSDLSSGEDSLVQVGTKWLANSTTSLVNFYKDTKGNLIGSYAPNWKWDNHLARLKVTSISGDWATVESDGWTQKTLGKTYTLDMPGMTNWTFAYVKKSDLTRMFTQYKTGGMVDYTGPAWVDGTPSKPEAFLSAADTANIAKLRDILSKVFDSNSSSSNTSGQNQNTGDTYYEFHITVDELGDGYDAKDMMADMEKYIIQKSNYRNVINIGKRK